MKGDPETYREGSCDVDLLLDGDATSKPVRYCPKCDAWICDDCVDDIPRRAKAMLKRQWDRLLSALRGLGGRE